VRLQELALHSVISLHQSNMILSLLLVICLDYINVLSNGEKNLVSKSK
jgi:hypothetical protein